MNMTEFRELPMDEGLTILNEYMLKIKNEPGRLEDKFKGGPFEFGYSLLTKHFRPLGIKLDKDTYQFVVGESNNLATLKTTVEKKKQEIVTSEQSLTKEELMFVKQLFKEKQLLVNVKSKREVVKEKKLFVPQMTGEKMQSGISVYKDVWDRWRAFKEDYGMYSGTDLLTLALEEFMNKYENKG
ncbi:hypothetical protein [Psychrobacillus sp. NPDC093180]|uniref:hypothetical protein n=1 Tax=Psychrobacillus sp. NPDC093180 TaxID=3364489 RepID=UPI0037FD7C77